MNASEKELRSVEGIGAKRASEIRRVIEAEFRRPHEATNSRDR